MKLFLQFLFLALFMLMLILSLTHLHNHLLQQPVDYVPVVGMLITATFCLVLMWHLVQAINIDKTIPITLTGETQSTTVNVTFLRPDGLTDTVDVPLIFNKTEEQSIETYIVHNYAINEVPYSYSVNHF